MMALALFFSPNSLAYFFTFFLGFVYTNSLAEAAKSKEYFLGFPMQNV